MTEVWSCRSRARRMTGACIYQPYPARGGGSTRDPVPTGPVDLAREALLLPEKRRQWPLRRPQLAHRLGLVQLAVLDHPLDLRRVMDVGQWGVVGADQVGQLAGLDRPEVGSKAELIRA